MRILFFACLAIFLFFKLMLFQKERALNAENTAFVKLPANVNRSKNKEALVKNYADKLKPYLKSHNYSTDVCFLINMHLPSGLKRFFIYDFKKDSVVGSGLVTHGDGSQTDTDSLHFSNIPNSNCTSLGNYKIGNEYSGRFGMAFKLHGLENSNSNAFQRFVVLHAHDCVPSQEVYPQNICRSLGCPTVNPTFLLLLKKYIDKADKPLLLCIYK